MADFEEKKGRKPGWLRRLLSPHPRTGTNEPAPAEAAERDDEEKENPDLDFQPGGWVGATEPRRRK